MKWLFISIVTLATSLMIGQSAAAQSAYDDSFPVTENLYLDGPDETVQDVTTIYGGWLNFNDTRFCNSMADPELIRDKFYDALEFGDVAVLSSKTEYGDVRWHIQILFRLDQNETVSVYESSTLDYVGFKPMHQSLSGQYQISMQYNIANDCINVNGNEITSSSYRRIYSLVNGEPELNYKWFYSTFAMNYPAGYEGQEVPSVAPSGDPQRTPRATVAVNDKDLTIDFQSAGGVNDYIYSWHLSRYVPSSGLDPQTLEPVEAGFDKPGDAHSTYLEHRGNYALSIRMCAADHDQEIPECTSLENTRAAWLDIFADGSYFSISTGGNMDSEDLQNCVTDDLGGQSTTRCQAKLMDDCALDGATMLDKIGQIPGLITCQLRNYFSGVRSLAMFLMIPSSHQLQQTINGFLDNVQAQLGFVYESFGILIGGIGDIVVAAGTANCVLPLGTWYGDDLELSLCQVRAMFGETAWTLAMTLIRGGVAFGFVFGSYRYLQAFFADRRASV